MSEEAIAVPPAVRRQQEAAEARRNQAYNPEETPEESGAQQGGAEGAEAEEVEEQQPAPAAPAGEEVDTGSISPAGVSDEGDETDWKAEYHKLESAHRTLQGKYNKEVPRLHDDLRQLREEVQGLKQGGAQQKPSEFGDEDLNQQIEAHRKELAEEFGEEYADRQVKLMKALARQEAQASTQSVESRVNAVQEDQRATKEDRFYATLNDRVPEWESINNDPKFHEWLAETIPETGEERQAALNRAANNLDGQQVASIFELFRKRTQADPKGDARKRKQQEVEKQVAPGKRKSSPPPNQPKSYSAADTKALEAKHRRGDITTEEFTEQMAEIQKAIAEGRYRR